MAQIVWGGLLESGVRWNDLWMLPLSEEDEAREGLMWYAKDKRHMACMQSLFD